MIPRALRRILGWPAIAGGTLAAVAFLSAALRLSPPAFDVARSCVAIIAILLAAKVLTWVAVDGARFVHAPSSKGVVRVEQLGSSYWSQRLIGVRRLDAN